MLSVLAVCQAGAIRPAAVASAFAFFTLRKKLGETTGIPDALVGLAEDAVVLAAGSAILPKA